MYKIFFIVLIYIISNSLIYSQTYLIKELKGNILITSEVQITNTENK